jgi:hypothetical protein
MNKHFSLINSIISYKCVVNTDPGAKLIRASLYEQAASLALKHWNIRMKVTPYLVN